MKNEVLITIEGEEWSKALDTAFKKLQKTAKVDGFRTGKVPRDMFEKKYGKETLYREAMENLIDSAYEKALAQNKEEIVAKPVLDIEKVDENGVTYKFTLISRPEVTLGEYKNIGVKKEKVEVTDEEAEHELGHLQQKYVDIVSVDREVKAGDIAVINFEGFKDGVPFEGGKAEKHELEIGSNTFIPGFEDQIIGMKLDEEKDITVTFPEDYFSKELAGKPAVFKVKLHEIKKKELPKMDDEFAKDVSEFDTLEELKNSIKEKMQKTNEQRAEYETEEAAINAVCDNVEVEIPSGMIDSEVENMMKDVEQRLQYQGLTLQQYFMLSGKTEAQVKDEMKEQAEKAVKSRLVIEAIIKEEDIKPEEKEVEEKLKEMAKNYGKTEEEMLKNEYVKEYIENNMKFEKAIKFIVDNAKFKK